MILATTIDNKNKKHKRRLFGIIVLIFCFLVLTFVGVVFIKGLLLYNEAIAAFPLEDKIASIKTGENYTSISDISPDFIAAVVAVEDKRFFEHNGFDLISFFRVLIDNIANMKIVGGGSTITQQLAKNMYFTSKQVFSRKVAELLMAFDIEGLCSKDLILELYLNIIYFGNGKYGVYDACDFYFGCEPSEMTFENAIYLAGIPQAPSVYSVDKEKGEQRARQVMAALESVGYKR